MTPERLSQVAKRAVELAAEEAKQTADQRPHLERQLADVHKALERLTEAVVSGGGEVQALVEAIKTQDERRRHLEERLAVLGQPTVTVDDRMRKRLADGVEEWRAVLGRQTPLARQIVSKLLAEKISFAPEDRDGRRGFRFKGTGTVEKLLAGRLPARLHALVSPTGFEPVLPA